MKKKELLFVVLQKPEAKQKTTTNNKKTTTKINQKTKTKQTQQKKPNKKNPTPKKSFSRWSLKVPSKPTYSMIPWLSIMLDWNWCESEFFIFG